MVVLRGVTAEQASRRPIARAHSIWEIVLHMTRWQREIIRRLRTRVAREPEDGDWPAPPGPTDDAWRDAVERLEAAQRELTTERHTRTCAAFTVIVARSDGDRGKADTVRRSGQEAVRGQSSAAKPSR